MVDKLTRDLNVIQNSDIEVEIDPITADLNIIQKLDDEPNDVGGLTAQELKAKFDEAGNVIKTFINESLIPQVLGADATEAQREANEQQRQTNEAQRQENETQRQENEAAREAAEAARNVWENYDPAKTYVPGNKVYYLGSSYVNTVSCTNVLPTVAANWQMIAKKGTDSDEGMSQEEGDLRYLQLSGGAMTGPMTVLGPDADDNPVPKWFVNPVSISVTKLPDKTTYRIGEIFQPQGMAVSAKNGKGSAYRITGYACEPGPVLEDTRNITVLYGRAHGAPLTAELPFLSSVRLTIPFLGAALPAEQTWGKPVFADGMWVMPPSSQISSSTAAYSEDGGKTWKEAALPTAQYWMALSAANGMWIMLPAPASGGSRIAAYSEDGGRTWKSATLPAAQGWTLPAFADGVWVLFPDRSLSSSTAAYSEDGGRTWKSAALPVSTQWDAPAYADGVWVTCQSARVASLTTVAAYSEDGGKTWTRTSLPVAQTWRSPVYADGVWVAVPGGYQPKASAAYSEDGGRTWKSAALPAAQGWTLPAFADGVWVLCPSSTDSTSGTAAYSEDGGRTWKSATVPGFGGSSRDPVFADGVWVLLPSANSYSGKAAYSEDGGKTWVRTTTTGPGRLGALVYGGGVWVIGPSDSTASSTAAYSEDGGRTWNTAALPAEIKWSAPVCVAGLWVIGPYDATVSTAAAYSEDGGRTWKRIDLPSKSWNPPAYGGGVWLIPAVYGATVMFSHTVHDLAPLPGEEADLPAPVPTLEDQVVSLLAENAALAAAVERGLSL